MDVQERFSDAARDKADDDVPNEMKHDFLQYQIGSPEATSKF